MTIRTVPVQAAIQETMAYLPPSTNQSESTLTGYLTKSRPDIMAAVSFGESKASRPTTADNQKLMYIVQYIRKTQSRGHRIYAASGDPLQFYCSLTRYTPTLKVRQGTLSVFIEKGLSITAVQNKLLSRLPAFTQR